MEGYVELEEHGVPPDASTSSHTFHLSSLTSRVWSWRLLGVASVCALLLVGVIVRSDPYTSTSTRKIDAQASKLAMSIGQQYAGVPLLHCHDSVAWGRYAFSYLFRWL